VQNQAIGLGGNTVLDTTDSVGFALGMRAVTGVFYRCGAPAAYQSK
jgi:hypothetical protein